MNDGKTRLMEFLEDAVKYILESEYPIVSVVIATETENGETGARYFDCSEKDMLWFSEIIRQDSMLGIAEGDCEGYGKWIDEGIEDYNDEDWVTYEE